MSHGILNVMQFHLLVLLCVFVTACAPLHEASVDVIVPIAVQEQYDSDAPGELLMQVETEGNFSGTYVLGVLCEPSSADRTAPWILSGTGCALQAEITAWVRPAGPDASCTTGPAASQIEDELIPEGAWVASGVLFAGNVVGCEAGDDALTLTLGAPRS